MRNLWIYTQNPGRFPGFAVVVVTFFSTKSSTITMTCFPNVSLSQRKETTHFGRTSFARGKLTISSGRETKTHILPTTVNDFFFC